MHSDSPEKPSDVLGVLICSFAGFSHRVLNKIRKRRSGNLCEVNRIPVQIPVLDTLITSTTPVLSQGKIVRCRDSDLSSSQRVQIPKSLNRIAFVFVETEAEDSAAILFIMAHLTPQPVIGIIGMGDVSVSFYCLQRTHPRLTARCRWARCMLVALQLEV